VIKKLIRRTLLKLAQNEKAKSRARILFAHFPKLKYKLVAMAYEPSPPKEKIKLAYKGDFLEVIKLEVENRKRSAEI
jgi:exonuclease III